jgi:hypothetical protein
MKNVEMTMEGKTLIIKIDTTKRLGKSASGKTEMIASTSGNVSIPENDNIKIGVNCYTK